MRGRAGRSRVHIQGNPGIRRLTWVLPRFLLITVANGDQASSLGSEQKTEEIQLHTTHPGHTIHAELCIYYCK